MCSAAQSPQHIDDDDKENEHGGTSDLYPPSVDSGSAKSTPIRCLPTQIPLIATSKQHAQAFTTAHTDECCQYPLTPARSFGLAAPAAFDPSEMDPFHFDWPHW